jgi:hypothetical protein
MGDSQRYIVGSENTFVINASSSRTSVVLAVSVPQRYAVAKFLGMPHMGSIAGKGLVHCMVEVLEQENSPWADLTHGNQYAEQLCGFGQGKMISAEGRSPIVYQVGKELLSFIGWNGN